MDKILWRILLVFVYLITTVTLALPQQPKPKRPTPIFKMNGLQLPNNATSIRENIVDTFSCEGRIYGFYADIENDCQIFHVCLPQQRGTSRWSFICPEETLFNQATFVCTRTENSIPCEESERYYSLNEEIGREVEEEPEGGEEESEPERPENASSEGDFSDESPTPFPTVFRRGKSRNVTQTTEIFREPTTTTVEPVKNARIVMSSKKRHSRQ